MKENEFGFVEDPRYRECEREALYGILLGVINLAVWAIGGYWLGGGSAEDYSYIMGFPTWFFVSCVANSVLAIAGAIYIVKRKMRDMPLGPMTEEEAAEYGLAGRRRS